MNDYLLDKFTEVFSASNLSMNANVSAYCNPCILRIKNPELCKISSLKEIHTVVKSMHPIKTPSPNEMLALFYQTYWDIVGALVIKLVQNFFCCLTLPR